VRVNVNGVRLFVDVDGEGLTPDGGTMRAKPTVILVHGGPGADHSVYKPHFAALSDIAQLVYYDHRGNGRSDPGERADWTLAQWGDDLKGLCEVLGIERPIVLGTSFGGFVALSYATRYPGHSAGLVLISTAAHVDFQRVYAAFERLGGRETRTTAEAYWEEPTVERRLAYREHCMPLYERRRSGSTDWLKRIAWNHDTALWFNGPHREHGRMDFRPDLGAIACPVLVLAGEDDPITPPEFSDALASGFVNADVTYVKYPDCGHGVMRDRPGEAMVELRRFICSMGE
jgi:pimeloyl-ACP methyl ester carboxylesterase